MQTGRTPPKQNEYKEKGDSAGEQVPKRPRIHVLAYEHRAPDERYKNRSGPQTIERIAEQAHWYIDDSPCDIQHQELLYGLANTEARPALPVRELPYIHAPKAQKCRCDKEERDGDAIDTLDKGGYSNGLVWISTTRNAMRNFTTSKSENTTLLLLTVLDGDETSSIKPPDTS